MSGGRTGGNRKEKHAQKSKWIVREGKVNAKIGVCKETINKNNSNDRSQNTIDISIGMPGSGNNADDIE